MTETLVMHGVKVPRTEILSALFNRDGKVCQFLSCGGVLDPTVLEGPNEVTIDHWIPQWYCKETGWTRDQTWDLSNLKLMHKKCNAKKGDVIPNDDGTLPDKPLSNFRFRRHKRANRPDGPCVDCNNGHDLLVGEICASCGCNAQRFPMSAKVRFPDCDHELLWCWVCSITPEMRPAAVDMAVLQGESGEWDD